MGYELPVSEIAARYCESMRDIWLRHVKQLRPPPSLKMVEGRLYHRIMHRVVEEAKKAIYSGNLLEGSAIYHYLYSREKEVEREASKILSSSSVKPTLEEYEDILEKARALWRYNALSIAASIDRERSRFTGASVDSIVARAIPQVAEYRIDGSRIGLSRQLSVDVYMPGYAVIDYKTGSPRSFHRLALAGYALALESETGVNVDVGVIVYISFENNLPHVKPVYHELGDEPRIEFLDLRDEALRIIDTGRDPGPPPKCYKYCPFREVCSK